jgi:TetR/AcrR family transcriptional regulator, cholesterol catabolism regulator
VRRQNGARALQLTAVTRRRGRSVGENTADGIRQVALDLFYKQGFQATTLRHIASRVGIQVGSLYNHIESKGDLLFDIMETVMRDLLEDQRQVAQTPDVVERMRLLVYHHVKFHGERAEEVFIGNSELRSLSRGQRARIVALRNEYEEMFQNELEDGIRQGKFLPVDVQITAYGILAMTTWVSAWYSPRGRLSLEDIAEIYTAMVLRGIWNPTAGQLETHLRRVVRDNAKRSLAASAATK